MWGVNHPGKWLLFSFLVSQGHSFRTCGHPSAVTPYARQSLHVSMVLPRPDNDKKSLQESATFSKKGTNNDPRQKAREHKTSLKQGLSDEPRQKDDMGQKPPQIDAFACIGDVFTVLLYSGTTAGADFLANSVDAMSKAPMEALYHDSLYQGDYGTLTTGAYLSVAWLLACMRTDALSIDKTHGSPKDALVVCGKTWVVSALIVTVWLTIQGALGHPIASPDLKADFTEFLAGSLTVLSLWRLMYAMCFGGGIGKGKF
ncbi:unnamed protein product [Chrysoparadoxa australica]